MFDFDLGIDRIYDEDLGSQEHYLSVLSEVRNIPIEFLKSMGMFYVPNQEYMAEYFKECAYSISSGLYDSDGFCKWHGYFTIPIRNIYGSTVGFVGYSHESKLLAKNPNPEISVPEKYTVSSSMTFDKDRFALIPLGFTKAYEDGYIIVVDGVFDAIHLASLGFNSFCSMGSTLGDSSINLAFIDTVYVAYDNDDAGLRLYKQVRSQLGTALRITQGKTKDIDAFLTDYLDDKTLLKLRNALNSKLKLDISL